MIEDIPDAFDDVLRVVFADLAKGGIDISFGKAERHLNAVQRFDRCSKVIRLSFFALKLLERQPL